MNYVFIAVLIIAWLLYLPRLTKRTYKCTFCNGEFESDIYKRFGISIYSGSKCYLRCPYCNREGYFPPIDK